MLYGHRQFHCAQKQMIFIKRFQKHVETSSDYELVQTMNEKDQQ